MKMRFILDSENKRYLVKAKRKSTGKWEVIGFCHLSAREYLRRGERIAELLRLFIINGRNHRRI